MKLNYLVKLCLLVSMPALSAELQLQSNQINMQAIAANTGLYGIDGDEIKAWKAHINTLKEHGGDLETLLNAQQAMADFADNTKNEFATSSFDFNAHTNKLLTQSKIAHKHLVQKIEAQQQQISALKDEVEEFDTKVAQNKYLREKAKTDYSQAKAVFSDTFYPADERAAKKFNRGMERDKYFKIARYKTTEDTCAQAMLEDAGSSKRKQKELRQRVIGVGVRHEERLYCPYIEFGYLKSKAIPGFIDSLSDNQKQAASNSLHAYLLTNRRVLTQKYPEVLDKKIKADITKKRRDVIRVESQIAKMKRRASELNNLTLQQVKDSEKRKLANYVNKSLMTYAMFKFKDTATKVASVALDGFISYDDDHDYHFVIVKLNAANSFFALVRGDGGTLNVDNAVDVQNLLKFQL